MLNESQKETSQSGSEAFRIKRSYLRMTTLVERSLRLIVNGKAAGNQALRAAVGTIRGEGVRLEVRVTWEGGDAAQYAAEAVQDDVDIVIAAGGDGRSTR